jgi:hypothetical protein
MHDVPGGTNSKLRVRVRVRVRVNPKHSAALPIALELGSMTMRKIAIL